MVVLPSMKMEMPPAFRGYGSKGNTIEQIKNAYMRRKMVRI